jgi:type IV pilus assembly protein PilO
MKFSLSLGKKNRAEDGFAEAAEKPKKPPIDFQQLVQDFSTLDPKDPGLWPFLPRAIILLAALLLLLGAAWLFDWKDQLAALDEKQAEEVSLKEEWVGKKSQAVNLDEYKRQLSEIERSFGALLQQLPNRAEMGDLLVDINKAAQGRGLSVEFFKPGGEIVRDFYAEMPISLTLQGSYHDIGAFSGDIATLPRIVTLNDINLAPATTGKGETLILRTTAKTFRYLDEEELAKRKNPKRRGGG